MNFRFDPGYNPSLEIKNIGIMGSADLAQDDTVCQAAQKAAAELAKRGYGIVNGGGPGVMQAATNGAKSVGGKTLTVTFAPVNAPHFEGTASENMPETTIQAANYIERIGLLIEKSDAFVIFKGGTGTISEWGLIWLLAHIYYGHHKPFVLFGDFWHELIESVQKNLMIEDVEFKVFRIVNSVEEMLQALDELAQERQQLQVTDQDQAANKPPLL